MDYTLVRFFRLEKVLDSQTWLRMGTTLETILLFFNRVMLKCLREQGIGGRRRSARSSFILSRIYNGMIIA